MNDDRPDFLRRFETAFTAALGPDRDGSFAGIWNDSIEPPLAMLAYDNAEIHAEHAAADLATLASVDDWILADVSSQPHARMSYWLRDDGKVRLFLTYGRIP